MALTKAEEKIEKTEQREARSRAKKKAEKLQMQELMYSGVLGAAEGVAEGAGIKIVTDGLGPIKFEWIQALAGLYLLKEKKGDARELGSALAVIGIYKSSKGLTSGFSLGDLFGGE